MCARVRGRSRDGGVLLDEAAQWLVGSRNDALGAMKPCRDVKINFDLFDAEFWTITYIGRERLMT